MITLFGATGYTGQLVAHALERRGLAFRLAGRSAERLEALSQSLTSRPATLVADVHSSPSLPALFDHTRLLINCAGPFTDLGEPVVALAAAHGTHYLDITNELAYVYRLRQYDKLARQTGAALVPACGFEVALADCAAALLARDATGVIDEIAVTYYLGGAGMSIGTRLSGLRTFATSWIGYRDGKFIGQAPGGALHRGTINGRPYAAITFPSAEIVTLPAHVQVRAVQVWMAVAQRNARLISVGLPIVSWLLRTPLGWAAAQVMKWGAPPKAAARAQGRWAVKVENTREGKTQAQVWSGRDAYGLTGEIAAYAAEIMTAADFSKAGVLAPAQALAPGPFLEWLRQYAEVTVNSEDSIRSP